MTITVTCTRRSSEYPVLAQLRTIDTSTEYGQLTLHDTVFISLVDVSTLLYGTDADTLPWQWGFQGMAAEHTRNSGNPFDQDEVPALIWDLATTGTSTADLVFIGNVLNRYMDALSRV